MSASGGSAPNGSPPDRSASVRAAPYGSSLDSSAPYGSPPDSSPSSGSSSGGLLFGMSTFKLKMLAIITMLVDHAGIALLPGNSPTYWVFRVIGRLSFPIFAFLLVEGYYHTRNIKKYLVRLAIFALISEIPYNLVRSGNVFYLKAQNIYLTLFIGLIIIYIVDRYIFRKWYLTILVISLLFFAAEFLKADYGAYGLSVILMFYILRYDRFKAAASFGVLTLLLSGFSILTSGDITTGIQAFAVFSILPICAFNGEKGYSMKYFFYAFYPAHLLALYALSLLL